MIILKTPINPEEVSRLRVNDTFFVTGTIYTARDAAHEMLLDIAQNKKPLPLAVGDFPCFHCGPVMKHAKRNLESRQCRTDNQREDGFIRRQIHGDFWNPCFHWKRWHG